MATLREHIEAIQRLAPRDERQFPMLAIHKHAEAALAILDFKPLDSDTPKSGDA